MADSKGKSGGGGGGGGGNEPQSFAKRDRLLAMEKEVQQRWENDKSFEADAKPTKASNDEKFFCTFPYPYMNGRLHLGHAFTISKAEFAARYQRLRGKNVLFPFAFHCTGMPIQAAANRLKRELEGEGKEEAKVEQAPADDQDAPGSASGQAVGVFHSKKTKAQAKTGNAATQASILRSCKVAEEEIPKFVDPEYWLKYFPPYGKEDLKVFGAGVDWRRSFVTTSFNPYYDNFISWQFRHLKEKGYLKFGKRPTIYSPLDGQACADHDRRSGEGVNPQEYTLIKLEIAGDYPEAFKHLQGEVKVSLAAATLRPETMYGQTNCFVLPSGDYGVYRISDTEAFVCSERSAKNMCYQGLSRTRGEVEKLADVSGQDLLGLPLKAPNAKYDVVYTLPLLTISMNKGTGVVTSVPSDAPDDYAALRDLKLKPKLREKFGITAEMVEPFDVVEIIDIPGIGSQSAVTLCDKLKIKSQNDKDKLAQAKEEVYTKGFYTGVMLVGSQKGKKVCDAKPFVRQEMIEAGQAAPYWEPEAEVVSRSGDVCVVAELDQWYLEYGQEAWKAAVAAHITSPRFKTYNPGTQQRLEFTLDWLKEWGCSRSFGLGTLLPNAPEFVIESLSDSTIYMSYYTVAHLLQADMEGSTPGSLGIKPEEITDAVWDYVFLDAPYPADCAIPQEKLDTMRKEFTYWYPMDLRVSGKDLIQNHLTMALYNHAAIWEASAERMPQGYFCNGHVMVDAKKMSKSEGNFMTLEEAVARYTADGVRLALAEAGDGLEDANFETSLADSVVLKLTAEEDWLKEQLAEEAKGNLRTGGPETYNFRDRVFDSSMNLCIQKAGEEFEKMMFRSAVKESFNMLLNYRNTYRDALKLEEQALHAEVVRKFARVFAILNAPFMPHFSEYLWGTMLGEKGSVHFNSWPAPGDIDEEAVNLSQYLHSCLHHFRSDMEKKLALDKNAKSYDGAIIYIAPEFAEWQQFALKILASQYDPATRSFPSTVMRDVMKAAKADKSIAPFLKKMQQFIVGRKTAAEEGDKNALSLQMPFDEMKVWQDNFEYVRKAIGVQHLKIMSTEDPNLVDPSNRKSLAVPGHPRIWGYDSSQTTF